MYKRDKSRYTDGVNITTKIVKVEMDGDHFIKWTDVSGVTYTSQYEMDCPISNLNVEVVARVCWDNQYSKWRLLSIQKRSQS